MMSFKNQTEFDNFAAGSVYTETNDLCTEDSEHFVGMVTSKFKNKQY